MEKNATYLVSLRYRYGKSYSSYTPSPQKYMQDKNCIRLFSNLGSGILFTRAFLF